MSYWCEIFYFRGDTDNGIKRVLVCSPENMKFLVQDAVELAYRKRGYTVERVEVLGRFDSVAHVDMEGEVGDE